MRPVVVKATFDEGGVGTLDAEAVWESEADACGAFAHLARSVDGRWWLSWTDMEEADGAYLTVEVTDADMRRLAGWLPTREAAP
jgi:hypothetical protein